MRQGTQQAQNYADGSFDAVALSHVIEHVHDARGLLREIFRVTRPSGTLLMATPNLTSLGHRIRKRHWMFLDPPRHLCVFTPQAIRTVCAEAGFGKVAVRSSARGAYGTFLDGRAETRSRETFSRLRALFMMLLEASAPWDAFGLWFGEELDACATK